MLPDQKNNPLVSVITVCYNLISANRKDFFKQCIESVQHQDYNYIEHIVIDGASDDGTVELIKDYAEKGIISYISEADQGIYDAMNKGIKIASGKYIVFLNSDDFYSDSSGIRRSVEALEQANADFCGSNDTVLFSDGYSYERVANLNKIIYDIPFCHQTMLTKKSVLVTENMFDTKIKLASDYDLMVRIYRKKYKGIVLDYNFTTFRANGLSHTGFDQSRREITKFILPKVGDFSEEEASMFHNHGKVPDKVKQGWHDYLYPHILSIITFIPKNSLRFYYQDIIAHINSIQSQTYEHIEHILVIDDDYSTDDLSDEMYLTLQAKVNRIIKIPYKNLNYPSIMMKVVTMAKGLYIYFANYQDIYDNKAFEYIIKKLVNKNADIALLFTKSNLLDDSIYMNSLDSKVIDSPFNSLSSRGVYHVRMFAFGLASFYSYKILPLPSFFTINLTALRKGYKLIEIDGSKTKLVINSTYDKYLLDLVFIYNNLATNLFEKTVRFNIYILGLKVLLVRVHYPLKKSKFKYLSYLYHFFKLILFRVKVSNNRFKLYLFKFILILKVKIKVKYIYKYKFYLFGLLKIFQINHNILNLNYKALFLEVPLLKVKKITIASQEASCITIAINGDWFLTSFKYSLALNNLILAFISQNVINTNLYIFITVNNNIKQIEYMINIIKKLSNNIQFIFINKNYQNLDQKTYLQYLKADILVGFNKLRDISSNHFNLLKQVNHELYMNERHIYSYIFIPYPAHKVNIQNSYKDKKILKELSLPAYYFLSYIYSDSSDLYEVLLKSLIKLHQATNKAISLVIVVNTAIPANNKYISMLESVIYKYNLVDRVRVLKFTDINSLISLINKSLGLIECLPVDYFKIGVRLALEIAVGLGKKVIIGDHLSNRYFADIPNVIFYKHQNVQSLFKELYKLLNNILSKKDYSVSKFDLALSIDKLLAFATEEVYKRKTV